MDSNKNVPMDNYDYLFKIVFIGDSGVGKSAIITRFADNVFNECYISTIGVDFKIKSVMHNGKCAKLQIWDTAGQERFRTITTSYYRGAHGIVIVYDVTDLYSFQNIKYWFEEIKKYNDQNIPIMLIGNKTDIPNKRIVSKSDAESFASQYGLTYIETSAKSDTNVDKAFQLLTEELIDKQQGLIKNYGRNLSTQDIKTKIINSRNDSNACYC